MKKIALIFLFLMLLSCTMNSEATINEPIKSNDSVKNKIENTNISLLEAREKHLSNLYSSSLPSIVHIKVAQSVPSLFSQNQSRTSDGSGFVWDESGHILTNYHVVANADMVDVQFSDGSQFLAKVIGLDPNSDLAIIKINSNGKKLEALDLGDSNSVSVGNFTLAIGSPFGQEFSMTSVIISAIKRTVPSQNSMFTIPNVIQTDAAINPGNSGGPLLDINGKVIGINSQIITQNGGNAGIGFAVPVNTAKAIVPTLINGEKFLYPWLGITGMDLSQNHKKALKFTSNTNGVMIVDIVKDSPANKSDLKGYQGTVSDDYTSYPSGGDIITAINGTPISSMNELISELFENHIPGDKVKLSVLRNSKTIEIDLELESRPQ